MEAKEYIFRLPDCYAKSSDSNNYKLLNVNGQAADELDENIAAVLEVTDIDIATGATLDLYGKMLGQARGNMNDAQYRIAIKAMIAITLAQGDINSVSNAIRMLLGLPQNRLRISEIPNEICAVKVDDIPYSTAAALGISPYQMYFMVRKLIPAGVRIDNVQFEGTFTLGSVDNGNVYDEEHGCGNVAQTIGGYFGAFYFATGNPSPT